MLNRILAFAILTSMVLHCASRVGILSLIYENRASIAYSIGFIAEVSISMCNSDYDFDKGLKISDSDSAERMPGFTQAHEINLFFISVYELPALSPKIVMEKFWDTYPDSEYLSPLRCIFHPPLV